MVVVGNFFNYYNMVCKDILSNNFHIKGENDFENDFAVNFVSFALTCPQELIVLNL